jgi:hypothetical protein
MKPKRTAVFLAFMSLSPLSADGFEAIVELARSHPSPHVVATIDYQAAAWPAVSVATMPMPRAGGHKLAG